MKLWIELFTSVFEVLLVIYFFSAYLGKFGSSRLICGLSLAFYLILLASISVVFPASLLRTAVIVLITYLFVLMCWRKGYVYTIYPVLLFFLFAVFSDILCGTLLQFQGIPIEELMGDGRGRIIYIVFGKLFHLLFLYIVLLIVSIKVESKGYEMSLFFKALPLLSCQILSIIICDRSFTAISSIEAAKTANIVTVGLLYINFIICVYVDILNRSYKAAHEAEQAKHQLEIQKNYYHDILARQEETRKLWHDIKKYMASMEALIDGDNRAQAQLCLENIQSAFSELTNTVDTGNKLVDSILGYGMKKAAELGVTIQPEIWIDSNINFPAPDLFVIIGNTLDNAIEACCQIDDEAARIVSVGLFQKNHLLLYEISNPYTGKSFQKPGKIHGYGLKNVEACVDRNAGLMSISTENGVFAVSIQLNLGE